MTQDRTRPGASGLLARAGNPVVQPTHRRGQLPRLVRIQVSPRLGVLVPVQALSLGGRRIAAMALGYVWEMADVTVFVDRAVQGDLPGVCVIDGVDGARSGAGSTSSP
jgi:hypothetical protein